MHDLHVGCRSASAPCTRIGSGAGACSMAPANCTVSPCNVLAPPGCGASYSLRCADVARVRACHVHSRRRPVLAGTGKRNLLLYVCSVPPLDDCRGDPPPFLGLQRLVDSAVEHSGCVRDAVQTQPEPTLHARPTIHAAQSLNHVSQASSRSWTIQQ